MPRTSLAEIIECFLPRGWFLSVTPGTKFVSVSGAVASDAHGKNHHVAGSFGNFVLSIRLLTSTSEILECSRQDNSAAFWATVGGMGLTGVIAAFRSEHARTRPLKRSGGGLYEITRPRQAITSLLAFTITIEGRIVTNAKRLADRTGRALNVHRGQAGYKKTWES